MPEKIPFGVGFMIVRNHKSKTDHPQGNASPFCITPENQTAFSRNPSHTGYDDQNRLVAVVTPAGTWTYEYDPLGNRIATIRNGQRTDYLLDPTGLVNVVGEYDGAGSLLATSIQNSVWSAGWTSVGRQPFTTTTRRAPRWR